MEDLQDFQERRKSLRVDMEAERILLVWTDKYGERRQDSGVCIDVSRRGVLVEYRAPFALGELIEVIFKPESDHANVAQGQVCRCTEASPVSYHIAMQLI